MVIMIIIKYNKSNKVSIKNKNKIREMKKEISRKEFSFQLLKLLEFF